MKKALAITLVATMVISCMCLVSFATEGDGGQSLDDIISGQTGQTGNENTGSETTGSEGTTDVTTENVVINPTTTDTNQTNQSQSTNSSSEKGPFNGLMDAANLLEPDVQGVSTVTAAAKTVASFLVQVLSYLIIAFMTVSCVLDLAYIILPPIRTFLANGYTGQAQSSGQGTMEMNNAMGMGMGGMGMGGSMGGMGGYGRGGYGMSRGYGMGGMGNMGAMNNQMQAQNTMMNRNSSLVGNIQFISNAALNAVATESAIGPDGKTVHPLKIYAKSMLINLIAVPILLLLCMTGVVHEFGFLLGNFIVELFQKAGSMI